MKLIIFDLKFENDRMGIATAFSHIVLPQKLTDNERTKLIVTQYV